MLEEVKVLSSTHYLQGSSVAQALTDSGANVVKAESCRGTCERGWSGCNTYKNGVSAFYFMANRNRREAVLDLKSNEGRETIYGLIRDKGYDVTLENSRPGVTNKLGLGYRGLRRLNPGVVYCSCTGYGSNGPKVRKPGRDLLIQGMSELAALTRPGDHPFMPTGTVLVDQYGAILAALGITAAVYDRDKTGKGHHIEASLLRSALDLQIKLIGYYLSGGMLAPRVDTGLSARIHQSPYGIYRIADKYTTLSFTSSENLEQVFTPDMPEGFPTKDQMDNRIEFDKMACRELLERTTNEWESMFKELGTWYAPANERKDAVGDEQAICNQCFMIINHPVAGGVKILGHANRYNGQPVSLRRLPSEFGESTTELLKEAGHSDSQIQEMVKQGEAVPPKEKQDK